jgi:hypothetical protein
VSADVLGHCLIVTSGDDPEVNLFDQAGGNVDSFRLNLPRQRVMGTHRREWIDLTSADLDPRDRPIVEEIGQALQAAEWLPLFFDLKVDHLGYVWLQIFEPPFGPGREWLVLTGSGELMGRVALPVFERIFEISEHGILGLMIGPSGEHRVQLFPLHRRGSSEPVPRPSGCTAG